jgi:O-antigen biosynthesis protein WbqP
MIKRLFDISITVLACLLLAIPMLLTVLAIKLTSRGPIIYWSRRVGLENRIFLMPKFRTMHIGAPQVATHLLMNSNRWITPVGHFLRQTSLDELPQLWSILRGDMSIVGPRPALFNQDDLIELRTESGVQRLRPGLTGWAQINGRDELEIPKKVEFDAYYLQHQSMVFDLRILLLTFVKVLRREGVKQADSPAKSDLGSPAPRDAVKSDAA